ncbi:MAG: exodeoxyribonuclease V subunit alpha [Buchnera aphidicola (Meitanaphis elongallis)]
MNIILLLEQAIVKKIITLSDFYFSISITQNQSPKTMMLLAVCISYATRMGHTCLPISILEHKKIFYSKENKKLIDKMWKITELSKCLRSKLLVKKIINTESYSTPLILINKKIYLNRAWKAEKKIFYFISQPQNYDTYDITKIKQKISPLLCRNTENLQKVAIILSIINKVTFVLGSPGTGKTTIVSKILLAISILSNKRLNIQLSAPTGKAANNLTKSIQQSISNFKHLYEKYNIVIKPAVTLHRLLKINLNNNINFKTIDHLVDIDLLIIDESSMIDIFIMEKLIDNISDKTKIIFLGDHNQLPSIHCGCILKDVYSYHRKGYSQSIIKKINFFNIFNIKNIKNYKFSNINDKICILKKNYRYTTQSSISKLSIEIKKNKFNDFKKLFRNSYKNIKFFSLKTNRDYKQMISNLIKNYTNYWINLKKTIPLNIMSIFNNHRIICALKNGKFGVKELNSTLENEMKKQGLINLVVVNKQTIYFGQPILILKNDYNIKLYNGDAGIIMYDDKKKLKAFFLEKNKKKTKSIPINLLPKFQTNWAMTIHKSQGSEFSHTILVLPNIYSRALTKELIYTAVTRATTKITIYSNKKTFIKATKNKTIRYSGLSQRTCTYTR